MQRLLAFLFASLVFAAFGYGSDREDVVVVTVSIPMGKMHEECQRVEAGHKRRYNWRSDAPVDFNIHYHKETEVFYPVKRDAMRGDGGTFRAKTAEDYCWMWTARDKPATISGRIELK